MLLLCHCIGEQISEKDRCKACAGKKTVRESKVVEVPVDKGMVDGYRITLRGEGDQQVGSAMFTHLEGTVTSSQSYHSTTLRWHTSWLYCIRKSILLFVFVTG